MQERTSIHGQWSNRWTFILAATSAAVGLGNIWKFTYLAGKNGGSAFVLFYLLCIIVVGIPLLMAEVTIGRWGRQNPIHAIETVAKESGVSKHWRLVGALALVTGFLILSYFTVITGWILDYILKFFTGTFRATNLLNVVGSFQAMTSNPWQMLFWNTVVIAATVFVIARGIEQGIEKLVKFAFPLLILILAVMIGYAMNTNYFAAALSWLFTPNFQALTPQVMLYALGQAFFSLGVAMGAIMAYGAYLPHKASITGSSFIIVIINTGIALLAGIAIFPIVFSSHLAPSIGAGMIFQTLPLAFSSMPWGQAFGSLFFIMLAFAAFTATISLLEPTVAWLIETFAWSRLKAALISGCAIWVLSLLTIFSYNVWQYIRVYNLSLFEALEYLTSNIMLPLGGLLIAIFIGWRVCAKSFHRELRLENPIVYRCFHFAIRYITPVAIILILLHVTGLFAWLH